MDVWLFVSSTRQNLVWQLTSGEVYRRLKLKNEKKCRHFTLGRSKFEFEQDLPSLYRPAR